MDTSQSIRERLAQTSASPFERALADLGQLAGANVLERRGEDAEPDAMWMFEQEVWVGFEAKSECNPDGEISPETARQAGGHVNYAADSAGTPAPTGLLRSSSAVKSAYIAQLRPSPTIGFIWRPRSSRRLTTSSLVAEWRWECITDDLLDGLPPDAVRAVRQLGKELAVRESMVFLDGPAFTGDPPGLRTIQRTPGPDNAATYRSPVIERVH